MASSNTQGATATWTPRIPDSEQFPRHPFLWGTIGVLRYELIRSLSLTRLISWILIFAFPVALILLAKWQVGQRPRRISPEELRVGFSFIAFALIPHVAVMLNLLMWATPVVNTELEGQTWIYSIVRPQGKLNIILGKYLTAIFWSIFGGLLSATIAIPLLGLDKSFTLWWTLARLVVLSSVAYGALYIAMGTLFQKRAMVSAFIYTLTVEGFLSLLPATINQLTVSFRLRCLLVQWLEVRLPAEMRSRAEIFDLSGTTHHLAALAVYVIVLLSIALLFARRSEYSLQPDPS
jgi:ABC-type transport system involved in multi-copper enzyme maturation permease subunit